MSEKDFTENGAITWDTFMQMPHDTQEAFLEYVTDRFHVGTTMIAQDLFGISRHTLYRYIQTNHLKFPMSQGGRVPDALQQQWKKWAKAVTSIRPATSAPSGAASFTDVTDAPSVDGAANAVGDVVRSMHDLYGRIRVTISIEPT